MTTVFSALVWILSKLLAPEIHHRPKSSTQVSRRKVSIFLDVLNMISTLNIECFASQVNTGFLNLYA